MKCPNCGNNVSDTARFCSRCGQPIHREQLSALGQEPDKICPFCGYSVPASAQFCNNCGHLLEEEISAEKPQDDPEPPPPESSPKGRRGVPVAAVIGLAVVVVLGAGAVFFLLKKPADPAPAAGAGSVPSVSSQGEQTAPASGSESPQDTAGSEGESRPAVAESQVEENLSVQQPAGQQEGPAVQVQEEWGQQEILITPTGSGTASLTLRQQYQGSWTTLFSCEAAIGRNGTTTAPAEGDGKTPAGTFPVLFCYGLEQPQTGIPFIQLTTDSVWVDDAGSPYYNCLTTRAEAGDASCEDTYSQFARGYYSCNIFFANNGDGQTPGSATPGTGSVRVLEGYQQALEPTNGDIKISAADMEQLLQHLDAAYSPVVTVSGG